MTVLASALLAVLVLWPGSPSKEVAASADDECLCSCVKDVIPTTQQEIEKFVEEETEKINKELIVSTTNLSSTVRKKESAPDHRPSAENVGYVGVTLLCLVGFAIVAMDANYIIEVFFFFKTKTA